MIYDEQSLIKDKITPQETREVIRKPSSISVCQKARQFALLVEHQLL